MTNSRPLHVLVAEALGCEVRDRGDGLMLCDCDGRPHGGEADEHGDRYPLLRYDLSWEATGPLVEKYGLWLREPGGEEYITYPEFRWLAERPPTSTFHEYGPTPLDAVCRLIVKLHEAGKLSSLTQTSSAPQ